VRVRVRGLESAASDRPPPACAPPASGPPAPARRRSNAPKQPRPPRARRPAPRRAHRNAARCGRGLADIAVRSRIARRAAIPPMMIIPPGIASGRAIMNFMWACHQKSDRFYFFENQSPDCKYVTPKATLNARLRAFSRAHTPYTHDSWGRLTPPRPQPCVRAHRRMPPPAQLSLRGDTHAGCGRAVRGATRSPCSLEPRRRHPRSNVPPP
jgi:hypothetical protein